MTNFDLPIHAAPAGEQLLPPGHTPYSLDRPRKHGCVPELHLGDDERLSFYALEQSLYEEYRPTCATESLLLDEITLNYWRLQRARNLESQALQDERDNHKLLALYRRYRIDFERSFYRALQLLRKVKAENAKIFARFHRDSQSPAKFVSQKSVSAKIDSEPRDLEDAA